jgi:hypothetical protein
MVTTRDISCYMYQADYRLGGRAVSFGFDVGVAGGHRLVGVAEGLAAGF